MKIKKALVWYRRDLRDYDNAALAKAIADADEVYCAFIFDRQILDPLPSRKDRRVDFIHASLSELDRALRARGGGLIVRHGIAVDEIPRLAGELGIDAVYANRDYEPQAKERDSLVARRLRDSNRELDLSKDHVIFDGDTIVTQGGKPFSVFTPYKNAWLKKLSSSDWLAHDSAGSLAPSPLARGIPSLSSIGFLDSGLKTLGISPGMSGAQAGWEDFQPRLANYARLRDYPAAKGVSRLSVHLRFGTLSIRQLVAHALRQEDEGAATWLTELVWRDFYAMVLDHSPCVTRQSYRPEYDAISWDDWPEGFAAWAQGRTGYPLIDAGMRQLQKSGWMHNRLRMLTASFLCKNLGIDWRLGESHFAAKLNDFDLSSNNGGWQWVASSGCDAQPYFRIFNPLTQSEKQDPEGRFIRRYLPELGQVADKYLHAPWRMPLHEQLACGVLIGRDYPAPIIDLTDSRQRTLERYSAVRRFVRP